MAMMLIERPEEMKSIVFQTPLRYKPARHLAYRLSSIANENKEKRTHTVFKRNKTCYRLITFMNFIRCTKKSSTAVVRKRFSLFFVPQTQQYMNKCFLVQFYFSSVCANSVTCCAYTEDDVQSREIL